VERKEHYTNVQAEIVMGILWFVPKIYVHHVVLVLQILAKQEQPHAMIIFAPPMVVPHVDMTIPEDNDSVPTRVVQDVKEQETALLRLRLEIQLIVSIIQEHNVMLMGIPVFKTIIR
jgi:hypothetical protein